ncbi:hypothetical protein [Hymenobacter caeli]|uniref:hypothetical protein n=1 Tax=Hymenobacter caeli TaxID=2735894 RepID=UPI0036D43323
MKPSAKRALFLPAWLERKYYSRAAGIFRRRPATELVGLVRGVGPFSALRGVAAVRWACPGR